MTDKPFSWKQLEKELFFLPDGGLNAAVAAVDRHKGTPNEQKTALIWEGEKGQVETYTFGELSLLSDKVANILFDKGVVKGDRVFIFLPRIPQMYYCFLGILKRGAIAGTMFSAFGPEGLKDRLENSQAKIVFTTKELLPRINEVKSQLPDLKEIIVVDDAVFPAAMEKASHTVAIEPTKPEDYAFMLYTSGTTGKPKGVVHHHYAILQQHFTARFVLDLKEDDIYWCTADPGWITGVSYSILGNWSLGVTTVVHAGRFDPDKWYEIIQKHKVTVWYTAPTAIRMLMAKSEVVGKYDLSSLRHLSSVGEPLNPEAISWARKAFGQPFHDTWFQTETGSIMIANIAGMPIKKGSMGRPIPGVTADIVDDDGKGVKMGAEGNLVLKPGWPSQMVTIWQNEEKFKSYFEHGWYYSGDRGYKDSDGYFWFVGRADDVIKTSGERVGPFEVESALIEYEGVVEAGVIGKPDEVRGEIIKAFVVLKPGVVQNDELKEALQEHVKKHLAGHAYPREIEFVDKLPKTRSGKIMRRVLKAKELNLPIGDTSTLEEY